jgi:hypothetical protein
VPQRAKSLLRNGVFLSLVLFVSSCAPSAVDTTPPKAVEDLSASAASTHSVRIVWTATGDDLERGRAAEYDIRYSTRFITDASFDTLPQFITNPPQTGGTLEEHTIENLVEGTTYYFAVKVRDEVPNISDLSNIASAITLPDTIAPATIRDLSYHSLGSFSAVLIWTATGDDEEQGRAVRYTLKRSRNLITDANWGTATEIISPSAPALAGMKDSIQVSGLYPETTYYFGIKVVDDFGNVSELSNTISLTTIDVPRLPKTWIVKKDGSGSAPFIQAAIDSSMSGDEIQVYPGIYFEAIDYDGKNIVVRSVNGPSETIIDALGQQSAVVSFKSGENNNAMLFGFTIRHGVGSTIVSGSSNKYGGGIFIADSQPTILGNVIEDNGDIIGPVGTNTLWGGGIYCDTPQTFIQMQPRIMNNIIRNNRTLISGGGIATFGLSSAMIDQNAIYSNETGDDGGGIYLSLNGNREVIVSRCAIHENRAQNDHGGGIYVVGNSGSERVLIVSNTVWSNFADGSETDDVSGGGGVPPFGGPLVMTASRTPRG